MKNHKLQINKNLCIGQIIVGIIEHFESDSKAKDKHLQYIASTLRKKHFTLKNGTVEDSKNFKVIQNKLKSWEAHAKLADKAWLAASKKFTKNNIVTTTWLILALINKSERMKKWYGFNDKKLDKFKKSGGVENQHIFASSRTATTLLECLDIEIAYYNFKKEVL